MSLQVWSIIMAYITNVDIEERVGSDAYVQLTDDDGDGVADVGVVDEARLAAEGEVNSYLARRYQVPIDVTTHMDLADILASFTLDLAEHRLRARRPPVPQDIQDKRAQAVEWLSRIADGALELPSAAPVARNPTCGTLGATTGEARLLSRDELSGH
jgi:phage gp36-like protein